MEKGLLEKTGKDLNHWITVVHKSGIEKHKAIIDFLKSEHGFTYGFANFVAHKSKKSDAESLSAKVDLIDQQYTGRENLKAIYKLILIHVKSLGEDVKIVPKKTSVSCIRKKQFALIKPATKTRVDLGLKIKDQEPVGVLENSGPFGTMCTHRIQLRSEADVTEDVKNWITLAYSKNV